MDKTQLFEKSIREGYASNGPCIHLGAAMLEGVPQAACRVSLPLKTLNRHGLIAGATGTGKTVTLQVIAESLCAEGVPVVLMDLKGDLSGIARAGTVSAAIEERHRQIGWAYRPQGTTVEFLSLSKEPGARLRATVSEFGPVLFSKILGLNDTQSSIVALIFKYADDQGLPVLDLKDFKQLLNYASNEGKEAIRKDYGAISPASVSTILRKVIELESQGAELFFGERSFEVTDLVRQDEQGRGVASVIRLSDIQDRPKLFSTFMLCLLAEIYATFPEAGDLEKPKLCIFIDEAHLIFNEASKALLDQIESIVKLIRSKGVGIFFCTQNPYDIPESVLAQLGLKMQHALRAFTEKDRKAIRKTAENYPLSDFYKTDELLTQLGIGQALVTALNEKGIPTPLAAVHLKAPQSRIGTLTANEIEEVTGRSPLVQKYNETIDRESAYELLTAKMNEAEEPVQKVEKKRKAPEPKSTLEELTENPMVRQMGRAVVKELSRGLLGVLGLGGGKKKRGGFF